MMLTQKAGVEDRQDGPPLAERGGDRRSMKLGVGDRSAVQRSRIDGRTRHALRTDRQVLGGLCLVAGRREGVLFGHDEARRQRAGPRVGELDGRVHLPRPRPVELDVRQIDAPRLVGVGERRVVAALGSPSAPHTCRSPAGRAAGRRSRRPRMRTRATPGRTRAVGHPGRRSRRSATSTCWAAPTARSLLATSMARLVSSGPVGPGIERARPSRCTRPRSVRARPRPRGSDRGRIPTIFSRHRGNDRFRPTPHAGGASVSDLRGAPYPPIVPPACTTR